MGLVGQAAASSLADECLVLQTCADVGPEHVEEQGQALAVVATAGKVALRGQRGCGSGSPQFWPQSHVPHRCGKPVEASAAQYDVFEQMHYICFHYEFEHLGDPDVECNAGGCPAAGIGSPSFRFRIEAADMAQAGNTVVPAILALRSRGLTVGRAAMTSSLDSPGLRRSAPRTQ